MNAREQLTALKTICGTEFFRIVRIWVQTLLSPAITTTLYFLIFGHIIGKRVGLMGGYDYIDYIAPGLVMLAVITSSYSSAVSAVFFAKFSRSIEEQLVSPMANSLIMLGYMFSGVIRGFIVGIVVAIVAFYFTDLRVYSLPIILAVMLFSTVTFSLAGVINGIYAKKFDDIAFVPIFILTPLTYLGGVFYSVKLLPKFWYYLSLGNPIVYIVNSFRYGFLGIEKSFLPTAFLMMFTFILILFYFTLWLFNRGVGLRN